MAKINDRDIANKALDKLKDRLGGGSSYWAWIKTKALLYAAGFNYQDDGVEHGEFRAVLNRLYNAGLVERRGTASFEWRLREEYKDGNWDRLYPFKKLPTAPTAQVPEYTAWKDRSKPVGSTWHKSETQPVVSLNGNYVLKTEYDPAIKTLTDLNVSLARQLEERSTKLDQVHKELEEWKHTVKSSVRTLEIRQYKKTKAKLKDVVLPKVFDKVRQLAEMRRNILLVGPAGCGKTYLGKLVADSLALDFGTLSLTSGISEGHLTGTATPNVTTGDNVYQGALFVDIYEKGGVFLLDELDAADPNVLLCINSALANGYIYLPKRRKKPRADRHDDFVCIGTANTHGRGANRMYSGRNQLDEATIDRFRIGIVECDYDPAVEMAVCPDEDLRQTLQKIREKINAAAGLRRIMSTRFLEDAYVMVSQGGWSKQDVLDAYFQGWSAEEIAKVA